MSTTPPPNHETVDTVWWRMPMMWLVLGGPATVVVASLVTCFIAFRYGDPPLQEGARSSIESSTPAMAARNHAATPRTR